LLVTSDKNCDKSALQTKKKQTNIR